MPFAKSRANAAVSSFDANAWYSWNSAEPSVSLASPGARESVTMPITSFFRTPGGANNGIVLS